MCSLFLSDFNETNFVDIFSKRNEMIKFMKIGPFGADLFYAG